MLTPVMQDDYAQSAEMKQSAMDAMMGDDLEGAIAKYDKEKAPSFR